MALWELKWLDFIIEQWGATEYSKWGELLIRVSFLKVSHQIFTVAWSGNCNHSLLFEWGNCSSGSNLPKITQKKGGTLGPLYPRESEWLSAHSPAQHSGLVAEKEGLDYKTWKENSIPNVPWVGIWQRLESSDQNLGAMYRQPGERTQCHHDLHGSLAWGWLMGTIWECQGYAESQIPQPDRAEKGPPRAAHSGAWEVETLPLASIHCKFKRKKNKPNKSRDPLPLETSCQLRFGKGNPIHLPHICSLRFSKNYNDGDHQ